MRGRRYLVSSSSLPEVTSRGGVAMSIASILGLVAVSSLSLMHSSREASEEHNEGAKEEQDHGGEDGPHCDGVIRVASTSISVDVVLDYAEKYEIACHDNQGNKPSNGCDCSR